MKVLSFDLGGHTYTHLALDAVMDLVGDGRLELVIGDSLKTVPNFAKLHPETVCDVIFVDGGHEGLVSGSEGLWGEWLPEPV